MKKLFIVCLLYCLVFPLLGQKYRYTVDLTRVVNDRIEVILQVPPIQTNEIKFFLPRVVPGYYSIADFGRLVHSIKAVDKKGRELNVEKIDQNSWKILNAKKLSKIIYWVDDSFDANLGDNPIFWPVGTNIEENKNFQLNTAGLFGYLDDMKSLPFEFNVIRPTEMYGATGLIPVKTNVQLPKVQLENKDDLSNKRVDTFITEDYNQLIDCPLLYSKPDTAIIRVGKTEVLISTYSPNKKITSKEIAATIKEVLLAQRNYLNGILPVEKYAFLFNFSDQPLYSFGALEHSYSSLYVLPEATIDQMRSQLRSVAAHEFFHIITPLTIHSEEIENFNYNNPRMSKHLWLYEGVTEYFAGNAQVTNGLLSAEQYLDLIKDKLEKAETYGNNVSFTTLSKYALENRGQYMNVYQKGALIGMCLDIKLLQLSKGKYRLINLIQDLSQKFGKSRPFEDDALFKIIEELTYPEIGDFLKRYVDDKTPLPLKEIFELVGVNYSSTKSEGKLSLGFTPTCFTIVQKDGKQRLAIGNKDALDEQGKKFGFENLDILWKINGSEWPNVGSSMHGVMDSQRAALRAGNELRYTILRKNSNGVYEEKELTSVVAPIQSATSQTLTFMDNIGGDQLLLKTKWLSSSKESKK